MGRYKARYTPVAPKVLQAAGFIYSSWNEQLLKHAERGDIDPPIEITRCHNQLRQGSLVAEVCAWIEYQGKSWQQTWQKVLDCVAENKLLQEGYKDWVPTLAWMFGENPRGRGIDKVLEGRYNSVAKKRKISELLDPKNLKPNGGTKPEVEKKFREDMEKIGIRFLN